MKTAFFTIALMVPIVAAASGPVRVQGHVTRGGTYVPPHYRSAPNSTRFDNYSTRGNYNPYTGKVGTQDPYRVPAPRYYSSPSTPDRYYSAPTPAPPSHVTYSNTAVPAAAVMGLDSPRYTSGANPPINPATTAGEIYRCDWADGSRSYISYPRAGCVYVTGYDRQAVAPSLAAPRPITANRGGAGTYFSGWGSGGSGHQAGREWAERKGITDPDDCGGNSTSFIEGCQEYAEAQQIGDD